MRNKILSLCLSMIFGLLQAQAVTIESTAGNLSSLVTDDMQKVSTLTIVGTMDARDFDALPNIFPELTSLDLSNVSVVGYFSDYLLNGKTSFEADRIPDQAFFGMALTSILLPENITAIGDGAFTANPIEALSLPSGVTEIGSFAFYDCDRLTSVTLSEDLMQTGDYLFANCESLTTVDLSATKLSRIEDFSFLNCIALQDVRLSQTLTEIGDSSFAGCRALKGVDLSENLISIGDNAFLDSGLESVRIGKNLRQIGEFAFACCKSLQSVEAENKSLIYGRGAFFYCPLLQSASIVASEIPDYAFAGDATLALTDEMLSEAEEIGDYALLDNGSKRLILPSTLNTLGDHAIEGMDALTLIDVTALEERVPLTGENAFEGIPQSEVTLRVADTTDEIWRSAEQWREFDIIDYSSVVKIESGKAQIKAWFTATSLCLSATDMIRSVEIYGVGGLRIEKFNPQTLTAEYDVAELKDNVYIVVVATDNEVASFKLIR